MRRSADSCVVALVPAMLLLSGASVLAAGKLTAPVDLTQTTPAKTDNSYNLGPTGALGWMHVEGGMTEKSRQILVTAVEKGSPAAGVLEVGDVILGVFGKPFAETMQELMGTGDK